MADAPLGNPTDDKSIRLWEWEIPVDFKNIAEPDMHSMPAVGMSRNGKWMAMQSMDNAVYIYGVQGDKFRANHKKVFKGHLVAGYACQVNFSSDGRCAQLNCLNASHIANADSLALSMQIRYLRRFRRQARRVGLEVNQNVQVCLYTPTRTLIDSLLE